MKSSKTDTAPEDFPALRGHVETWKAAFANTGWTPWLILGLAIFLRFFLLGIKPPHFDEGINGWFVDQMVKNGFYRYDPTNYHGPLHFYVLLLSQTLFGRNVWALRLPVVLVSIAAVWLTMRFEPLVGRTVSRMAALAMAVSPAFVFYGRYSIHEVWLLLFSMMFILGLLGLWKFGTRNYLWYAGMGVAGMILTKETYTIHLGCAAMAGLVCYVSNLLSPTPDAQGGFSRSALRSGPRPVLQEWRLPVVIHLLASTCLITAGFLPSLASRWRDYMWLFAALGLFSAFFIPMKVAYGKLGNRQFVRAISGRWTIAFFFSVCAQVGFFLAWPWNALVIVVGLLGVISAFLVPIDRVFVVRYDRLDLAVVLAVGTFVILFFYSGTFFHWGGVKGIFKAYSAWFSTGEQGHGHEKPWPYWLKLMAPSFQFSRADCLGYELPALAGLVLCAFCQFFKNLNLRYLAIYGVGTLMVYSYIRYKTPWCIISIIWPFLFIFGAAFLIAPAAGKRIVYGVSAVLLAISLTSTVWLNYFHCTTDTEPYVYVQTYNDIYKLTRPVLALAHHDPIFYQMTGRIIRASPYPLPWILDDFPRVGYYEHNNFPSDVDADFLLVQEDEIKQVEAKLRNSYYTEPLRLRAYQDTSKLYLSASIFKGFFPGRAPDFVGHAQKSSHLQ
jgi:predicted membrane-bound mannosyltransferase